MYEQTVAPHESPPQVFDVPTSAELTKFWKEAGNFFVGKGGPANRTEFLTFHTVNGWPVCTDEDWHKTNQALASLTRAQLRLLTDQIPEWATRQAKLKKDYPHGFALDLAPAKPEPVKSEAYLRARAAESAAAQEILNSPEHKAEAERRRQAYDARAFRATRPDQNHIFPIVFHENGATPMEETLAPITVTPVLPNIHQRIARVYAGIGSIPATAKNTQYNYTYIPQSAILAKVRELLAENGIVLETHFLGAETEPVTGGKNGGERVKVRLRFALVNSEDQDDRIVFEDWPGSDTDFSGKGLGKGIANARRTFLISQFLVSDDEPEHPQADNGNGNANRERDTRTASQPPRNAPPTSEPPPEPPNDQTTVHPRDEVLQEFKALREAERTCGLTPKELTTKQVAALAIEPLRKEVGESRGRLLKRIQELERERYDESGVPATPKNELWEMENRELARHAVETWKELQENRGK
ncbi:MAG: ERF family protein [Blastocatellia bacterium]|nr:ERF family protein [Blastocatellia bacterium]